MNIKKSRTEQFISFGLAFASVLSLWLINPPSIIGEIAVKSGVHKDSTLYKIIVNLSVPFFLTVAAWFSLKFFNKFIWPILSSTDYKGGWWVYSLIAIAETPEGPPLTVPVVGYFHVIHTPEMMNINEGCSFYFDSGSLSHRGDWCAESVWQIQNKFRFVFSMHTINNPREPVPSNYEGFIEVEKKSDKPYIGVSVWCGYFNDLKDRKKISGQIYAEFLKRSYSSASELRALLDQEGKKLVERVKMRICPPESIDTSRG